MYCKSCHYFTRFDVVLVIDEHYQDSKFHKHDHMTCLGGSSCGAWIFTFQNCAVVSSRGTETIHDDLQPLTRLMNLALASSTCLIWLAGRSLYWTSSSRELNPTQKQTSTHLGWRCMSCSLARSHTRDSRMCRMCLTHWATPTWTLR